MPPERRSAPRLKVLDQLHGHLVPMNLPLVVRELGAGGFSVESAVQFPHGARHRFRFTTAVGAEIIVDAAVVHSRPSGEAGPTEQFITGFAFCLEGAAGVRAVSALLDAMTSELEFQ